MRGFSALRRIASCLVLMLLIAGGARAQPASTGDEKPLMRDFMGLNGHTVNFKPELYRPTARLVRDYHNIIWDLDEKDTSSGTIFPMSRNGVNWETMYRSWVEQGFEINLCAQFVYKEDQWKDIAKDAYDYGKSVGAFFGPRNKKLVTSVQIGNEPGDYSDEGYRKLFENMARGLREADPDLLIVTCNAHPTPSGKYWKSLTTVQGLEDLYDAIAVHTYPMKEHYPTWRRSYPEDPSIEYLDYVQQAIDWRDRHAPGKQVWITEFGYDASTKEPDPKNETFKLWEDVTDAQQAQYLVRSFLVFAKMDVDRAYMYFFNDSDEPSFHASSGLTRNFQPKPAYYAQAHLQQTLGDYRFGRAVTEAEGDLYVYEFAHGKDPKKLVWVAWSPSGSDRTVEKTLQNVPGRVVKSEVMPLKGGAVAEAEVRATGASVTLRVGESPTYLWIER